VSLLVDIKKDYGKFKLDVSFETEGITGLLGASGCGKTVTLKCIAGIEKPDKGKIILDGITLFDSERRINLTPQKRKVGYLFQNYALFPNMNVCSNILCGIYGEDKSNKKRKLLEIIELMQLGGMEKHKPHQLSGGQQQRVALARIMIGDPHILMLDEPFSSLDSHLSGLLQVQMLKLLKEFGKDVLMVTHSRDEAYRLCDSIALIENGNIVTHKDTKMLFSDPGSRYAAMLTGCKNIADAIKSDMNEVEVPAWGLKLTTKQPVQDGLKAVGIRAHSFDQKNTRNKIPVCITGMLEEPFEYTYMFRCEYQDKSSPDIWWQTPKNAENSSEVKHLGVAPADVLLLYE